jgi:hypothetical protein
MGFRMRKSIKLAPGVRLNVSKRGVGASIGGGGVLAPAFRGSRTRRALGAAARHPHARAQQLRRLRLPPHRSPASSLRRVRSSSTRRSRRKTRRRFKP